MSKKNNNYDVSKEKKKELIEKEEAKDLAVDLSDKEAVNDLEKKEEKEPVIKRVSSKYNLNLRMEDSTDSDVLLVLKPNSKVKELQVMGDWSYVSYTDSGITCAGFVMNKFLK